MNREQYIKDIMRIYSLVSVLSDKNDCLVLRLRHKEIGRDLVLRSFKEKLCAYECLLPIRSQNLPVIFDVITLEDGQIVLEEFIDGLTISQIMECGKYRYGGAKKVLTAVCSALNILHERGLVHRDVKPENVIVCGDGRVVLIDFNASRKISDASRDTVIMGTVGYASPEQLGVTQSDARTDIYAAGVLLNVMLIGKHPSEQLSSGKAGRIVRKCTLLNQDERYQTATKLARAL